MPIGWSSLTFTPSGEAVQSLAESWKWLIKEPFSPVLFSILGDVFLQPESGGVWWLNTGTAELTRVADSVNEFRTLLGTDLANNWFMPGLVESLHKAGKVPGEGECFTYAILPVFREGKYVADNLNPVPAREAFGYTGDMHRQIASLPDGAKVKVSIGPEPVADERWVKNSSESADPLETRASTGFPRIPGSSSE